MVLDSQDLGRTQRNISSQLSFTFHEHMEGLQFCRSSRLTRYPAQTAVDKIIKTILERTMIRVQNSTTRWELPIALAQTATLHNRQRLSCY